MAVVGHETHSPVITLAIVYNTGARHETDADVGLTHCLRMAVNQVLFITNFLMPQYHRPDLLLGLFHSMSN